MHGYMAYVGSQLTLISPNNRETNILYALEYLLHCSIYFCIICSFFVLRVRIKIIKIEHICELRETYCQGFTHYERQSSSCPLAELIGQHLPGLMCY